MKIHILPSPVRENALVISLDEKSSSETANYPFRLMNSLLIAILLLSVNLSAQVTAGFTINAPVPNCNPAVYSFSNTSSGIAPLTYEWYFGVHPGINSIFQNPSTTYLSCGSYNVKLVVTNGIGQKDSSVQTISIRCSPEANFTASNLSGCIPFSTNFTSSSQPGSGSITGYLWDFGDGYNSTGTNPGHIYNVAGCKTVTLIVTNSFNCVHDTTIAHVLCTYAPPISSFTSTTTHSCSAPFTVAYQNASDSGLAPYSYHWIFQGGLPATSNIANPTVTYNAPGSYTTTLIVTDANGCSDTSVQSGYVSIPSNTADFTLSAIQGCTNTTITCNGISSGYANSWKWTVTPAAAISNDTSNDVALSFVNPGTYNVCLTINNSGCLAQKCSTVVIHPNPLALYSVQGSLNTCIKPDIINFTDSSSGAQLLYNWSFPGGIPSSSSSPVAPVVSYNTCGQFSASLIVTDSFGCSASYTTSNFLTVTCPAAWFFISPSVGCTPLTCSFNSGSTTGNPVSWSWDFGDTLSGIADTSSVQNPVHIYNYPGCYSPILTATNAQGCTYSDTMPAGVCTGHKPHANFSGNPPENCANLPIFFTDSSTNTYTYTTYVWDFHGGPPYLNESILQNPTYIYNDTGYKNISLIVSNYGCADTITKDDFVNIEAPVAMPKVIASCGSATVILDGTGSFGAQEYSWFIPDGNPSSASTPTVSVTYPSTGLYTATLSVTNDSNGCSFVAPINFQIDDLKAQFTASPLFGCAPLSACMSNLSNPGETYTWDVTDTLGNEWFNSNFPAPCFSLNKLGVYNVRLIVSDGGGCADTLYKPKYIRVNDPAPDFQGTPVSGCAPLKVNFEDLSFSATSTISSWNWNFGDSSVLVNNLSAQQNPSHTYNHAGTYSVNLIIGDNMGCSRNISKIKYVNVSNLNADFNSTISNTCQGTYACFTYDSSGTGLNFHWNFGDGDTSISANPCHNYTSNGTFPITLTVSNNTGCVDSSTLVSNISVSRPHAVFAADTTYTSCPPLQVTFSNLSTAITPQSTYYWDFGDGQVSSAKYVTHIYNLAGTFNVSLIVTNPNGCRDTLLFPQYIHVGGPSAYISIPPTSGCVPHTSCFDAISASTISFTWNYGDGTVYTGASTSCYTYTRTGTFYPELILNDGAGCIYAMPVGAISIGGSVASFVMNNNTVCRNGTILFTDSSSGISQVSSWYWTFGDPASGAQNASTLQDPSHQYSLGGQYPVSVTINTYDGCSDTSNGLVTVTSPPSIIFSEVSPVSCSNQTVIFQDQTTSSSPVVSRLWNFGDPQSGSSNSSTILDPSHLYAVAGTYNVRLTEVADNGCADSSSNLVIVNQSPVASFSGFSTCMNTQPVNFKNSSLDANFYQWYFGDGNSSAEADPANIFPAPGSYTVRLIAQNNVCSDTVSSPVQIYPIPNAAFYLSAIDECGPPFSVTIQNNTKGAIDYTWNFGNNITATSVNAAISYQLPGQYLISLAARNTYLCIDTSSLVFNAHQKVISSFTASDTCLNTQPILFSNTSQFATSYKWMYGDGNSSQLVNPAYIYSDSGVYTATLIASNNYCQDTFSLPVKIYPVPEASFTLASDYLCGPPAYISVNNTSSGAASYSWDFGNATTSKLVNATTTYTLPGSYVISLSALNSYQCYDTAIVAFVVYPNPVINSIDIQPAQGCQPLKINVHANVTNGNSFTWDFGDRTSPVSSNSSNATYIYNDTGTFSISLQVISFKDCGDTAILTDTIKVHIVPIADFSDTLLSTSDPENGSLLFTNTSQNADFYLWDFGDGSISTAVNPKHLFREVNTYEVKLVAQTKFGCADSITKSVYEVKKTLYVPNAFAPDFVGGSNLVKVWQPAGIGLLKYHAQVFDKWGELLWESTALTSDLMPAEGWDGTYQGKICQQDAYVWKIEAFFIDGTRWEGMSYDNSPRKTIGSVTLIR